VQKSPANPSSAQQCREWIQALNDGAYDYAVIGPDQRTQSLAPVEAVWTFLAGGRRVEENDDIFVFQLNRELNPAACTVHNLRGLLASGGTPDTA
jgi:hypothetical protein